jgi:hypothetical protein
MIQGVHENGKSNIQQEDSVHQQIRLTLDLRTKLVKCYIWSIALYGAETWTLRKLDQKYLESFEMWYWRRMEKISWTHRVNNEAALHRVKKERNILHTIRRRKE